MERPGSIIWFERLYLGATFVGTTVSFVLERGVLSEAFWLAITVLFWHLIAVRGSTIAKWIFVLLNLAGLLVLASVLVFVAQNSPTFWNDMPSLPIMAISLTLLMANLASLIFLFMPDARAWFAAQSARRKSLDDPNNLGARRPH